MKGVKHTADRKIRVYVKVGTGKDAEQREKRFDPGTRMSTIKEWRRQTESELRERAKARTKVKGSLAEDIEERYLPQVESMPTFQQRKAHLEIWCDALGGQTPRSEIDAAKIRAALQTLRKRFGPATCNKLRSALMHVWSTLDGKGGANPVRDVPKFPVADPLPRGRDPHVIDAALTPREPSRMRACCRAMLWTGMRPVELQRAEPGDFDEAGRFIIIRTAKGGRTRVVPLSRQGVEALKELNTLDAWQKVPQAAPMNRWLKHVTGLDMRVYDLRHSFATELARKKTRLDVIATLLGHSTLDLTRRYLLAVVGQDALNAIEQLGGPAAPKAGDDEKTEQSA